MEWIYTQTIDHIDYETAHAYVVYNIYAQTNKVISRVVIVVAVSTKIAISRDVDI